MSVLPMKSSPHRDGQDDDRAALRAAIAAHKRAKARVGEHQAAIDRARDLLVQLGGKSAARLADAISAGKDIAVGVNIGKAALTMVERQDDVGLAQGALAQLRASTSEIDAQVIEAANNISIAINALLAPIAQRAFDRLRALDAERYPLLVLLGAIQDTGSDRAPSSPRGSLHTLQMEDALHAPLDGLRAELSDYFGRAGFPDLNARRVWKTVREGLREDPDLDLPWPT